ncbi:PX domain containing protein [Nitzschia inconspicua]|uniref:PX domain containing protein n=1 Tax=Nitzschia inconspicua TaxID=303405 RepID=A0A9K3K4T1_9STRA|nr:PX domain containing protein [Nitzschia inconspicua]KAG7343680.1 PX domain containing protein [Nitzschia inconspicua]
MTSLSPNHDDDGETNAVIKPPSSAPMMYLAHEDWSPRFETTFYTIRIDGYELVTKTTTTTTTTTPLLLPPSSLLRDGGGKTNLPAYYYKITVFCGHYRRMVLRRYSQFEWLYKHLPLSVVQNGNEPTLVLPPKTPCLCQPQNDAFAQNRMEQLQDFLRDVLIRRGAAQHDAVAKFLELEDLLSS